MMFTAGKLLNHEQEYLIPHYLEKWRSIALSTQLIEQQKAIASVKEAYNLIGLSEPRFIFCRSPYEAWNSIPVDATNKLAKPLMTQLGSQLELHLRKELGFNLASHTWSLLNGQLWVHLEPQVVRLITNKLLKEEAFSNYYNYISIESWACSASWLDFCFSVLTTNPFEKEWQILQSLLNSCGWIFPFEGVCIISARPTKISFDSENRLHAVDDPALQFADGFNIYAHHGTVIESPPETQQS